MKTLLLILLALLLVSCGGNQNEGAEAEVVSGLVEETDFFVFDLEKGIDEGPKAATLNELIDSICYIPLETRPNVMLPDDFSLRKIGNDMYISGGTILSQMPVFHYDSLGQFVKLIIHHGRGPNEITALMNWYANTPLKQINAIDSTHNMVVVQTESGNKSTVKINSSRGFESVPLNDSTFVSAQSLNYRDIPNTYLYFTDRAGNLAHAIERNDDLLNYNTSMSEGGQAPPYERYWLASDYKGDAIFHDIFNDTLYRIKSHREITPHLVFKRGALSPRPEDKQRPDNKNKQVYFIAVMESGDHVFLNYYHEDGRWRDVWSKGDGRLLLHTIPITTYAAFFVQKFYVPFSLPDGSVIDLQIVHADQDSIYGILRALDACKFLPDVKEDDNPVILIAKLKK